MRVLIATRNDGKVRELRPVFAHVGLQLETLQEAHVVETPHEDTLEMFDTFEANALSKARWFAQLSADRVVFADDSGLEVDALGGAPGVCSKRWSGRSDLSGRALDEANNAFLQQSLESAVAAGRSSRTARYVCAAACVWPDGELVVRAQAHGRLLNAARGDGGFGYDPYFYSDELEATFAEVSATTKARESHRGRAFRALLGALPLNVLLPLKLGSPVDQSVRAR